MAFQRSIYGLDLLEPGEFAAFIVEWGGQVERGRGMVALWGVGYREKAD